jgi:tetratricopeptide (TPR) repeat protein
MRALQLVHELLLTAGAALAACALAACGPSPAAGPPVVHDPTDQQELETMRAQYPRAADLLSQGEALVAKGALHDAIALFRQAETENPNGSLAWRRDCETRTVLGDRDRAVIACSSALERSRSSRNLRALVSALVDGPTAPTTTQLTEALIVAASEYQRAPGGPTAAAAACTIAERIGNVVMLERCAEELQRTAPDDPATRRALAVLSARCPPGRFWAGWLAIAAAVLVTVGHALRGWLRRMPRRSAAAAVTAMTAALLVTAPAGAQQFGPTRPQADLGTKFPIDDENPEKSIPSEKDRNANPLEFGYWIQDIATRADRASHKGDHMKAAKFYEALATAVPDRAVGAKHACMEYEEAGQRDLAINACARALTGDGLTVGDYQHFVHLVLAKEGRLGERDVQALDMVLTHMREDPGGHDAVDALECEIGTRTSNVAQLRECTANLAARSPNDVQTITYQWALAIQEGKYAEAERLIDRARDLGLGIDRLDSMRQATSAKARQHRIQVALAIAAIALLLAGVGVAGRAVLQRRRLTPKPV